MLFTNSFIYFQREDKVPIKSKSYNLMVRTGMIHRSGSGLYDFMPLGNRVIRNIENIVRDEMNKAGSLEVSLPILQSSDLWKVTDRWDVYGDEMWKLKDRHGVEYCLSPTNEEMFGKIVKDFLDSYKQFPVNLYQIGRKFRDEMTPRLGLIRAREFLMKDAYSFHTSEDSLINEYQKMRDAYKRIFKRLNLDFVTVKEDPGEIGGSFSEEFLAFSSSGEDRFIKRDNDVCEKVKSEMEWNESYTGLEIGHIFMLGDKYSKKMNITFKDNTGKEDNILMGCYGIGISRLVSAIIEQNYDDAGIIWPKEVAPFDLIIVPLNVKDEKIKEFSENVYSEFMKNGFDVLYDNREDSAGVKLKTADLIGIPYKLIIGPRGLSKGVVEFENRRTKEKTESGLDCIIESFRGLK